MFIFRLEMIGENFESNINICDIKEFEKVFKSHYVRLTLFANKFLNDIDVSEEIVSGSLASLWENRNSLNISTSVSAYLYRMVRNRSLNYIKRQKVENEYVNYLIRNKLIDELPDHDCDPYQEKEIAEQIRIAVDSLPQRCREIFVMSRFQYLKNREIAERLCISQNTVERQITIALDKLRKKLEYVLGPVFLWFL